MTLIYKRKWYENFYSLSLSLMNLIFNNFENNFQQQNFLTIKNGLAKTEILFFFVLKIIYLSLTHFMKKKICLLFKALNCTCAVCVHKI